jgi:hypothetical protein
VEAVMDELRRLEAKVNMLETAFERLVKLLEAHVPGVTEAVVRELQDAIKIEREIENYEDEYEPERLALFMMADMLTQQQLDAEQKN